MGIRPNDRPLTLPHAADAIISRIERAAADAELTVGQLGALLEHLVPEQFLTPPPPPESTSVKPGPDKVLIMRARVELGAQPFHTGDRRL